MKLAIVSDIHGNLAALEAVAADIRRQGADQTVNLGDSLSGPLLPLETAQFLMAQGWLSMAGNHERQILTQGPHRRGASDDYAHSRLTPKEFDWLRTLSHCVRLSPVVLLCHGTPDSDLEYLLDSVSHGRVYAASAEEIQARIGAESASLIACGHSHIARSLRSLAGQCLVNPGSVGLPAYTDVYPGPHAVETGSPDARYAIVESSGEDWIVSLRSVPYDFKSMAHLARARGRPEWEHALLTGYVP